MNVSVYDTTIRPFTRGLAQLKGILAKGRAFAEGRKLDFAPFLQARLAPDQFPLARQVQIVCDTAKMCAATLAGVPAPVDEDKEQTFEEFLGRIDRTIAFLETLRAEQFDGFEKRRYTNKRRPGKHLMGKDYLFEHALPNFYFHLATGYGILRSSGVDLGKADYLGTPNWQND